MKKILSIIIIFILVITFGCQPVRAEVETRVLTVSKDEVINHDYLAIGESINISGTINGDAYVISRNLTVDGKINGDLLAAAATFTLLGEVNGNVRLISGDFFGNGKIGRNLSFVSGNINLTRRTEIGGSLLAFANYLDLQSPIGREANIFAQKVNLDNEIGGDLKASVGELTLGPNTNIGGDLDYKGPKEMVKDQKATINGQVKYQPADKKEITSGVRNWPVRIETSKINWRKINLASEFFSLLFTLLLGVIFWKLFPKKTFSAIKNLADNPWRCLGIGILAILLFLPTIVMLVISLIGIPFIPLFVLVFLFIAYISRIFPALYFGQKYFPGLNVKGKEVYAMLVGLVIYYLIRLIPVIGGLAMLVVVFFGLGAYLVSFKTSRVSQTK